MWVMTEYGDLVNIDRTANITKNRVSFGEKIQVVACVGDEDDTRHVLWTYDTAEQAQDAIAEIYKHLEKGDTAM